jgi:hypothetical protein
VRAPRTLRRTTSSAVSRSVRHAGWTTIGRAPSAAGPRPRRRRVRAAIRSRSPPAARPDGEERSMRHADGRNVDRGPHVEGEPGPSGMISAGGVHQEDVGHVGKRSQPIAQPPPPPELPPGNPMSNDDVSRSKVRPRESGSASDRRRALPSAHGRSTEAGSLTCMTTSTDWPAVVPRKTGKHRVTKESSRDGIACSPTHFSVFSQVGNPGCIEFLNRESQVRFLPGARGEIVEASPISLPSRRP